MWAAHKVSSTNVGSNTEPIVTKANYRGPSQRDCVCDFKPTATNAPTATATAVSTQLAGRVISR